MGQTVPNGRLPQIAEAAGPEQGSPQDAGNALWRQPSGQEGRAAGGLLGRAGLFRSRSSDREEARASEMAFVKRGPSAQREQPAQQQPLPGAGPALDDVHGQQGFRGQQEPLGAADLGHLGPPLPSWDSEGEEELSGDFLLGSHHEVDVDWAQKSSRHFPKLPLPSEQSVFAHDQARFLDPDDSASFNRGSGQLIEPPQGWHADAASENHSAHSGGLFEPMHSDMLQPHASGGSSSLTWHEDQSGSEPDLEAGLGATMGDPPVHF